MCAHMQTPSAKLSYGTCYEAAAYSASSYLDYMCTSVPPRNQNGNEGTGARTGPTSAYFPRQ